MGWRGAQAKTSQEENDPTDELEQYNAICWHRLCDLVSISGKVGPNLSTLIVRAGAVAGARDEQAIKTEIETSRIVFGCIF